MLVDVGVKIFMGLVLFYDQMEKEVNNWLASNRNLYISSIKHQVSGDRLVILVTYGKEKKCDT